MRGGGGGAGGGGGGGERERERERRERRERRARERENKRRRKKKKDEGSLFFSLPVFIPRRFPPSPFGRENRRKCKKRQTEFDAKLVILVVVVDTELFFFVSFSKKNK